MDMRSACVRAARPVALVYDYGSLWDTNSLMHSSLCEAYEYFFQMCSLILRTHSVVNRLYQMHVLLHLICIRRNDTSKSVIYCLLLH